MGDPLRKTHGPFHADQLHSGDPYELSNGHAIRCLPTGGRGSLATGAGYRALVNDPEVEDVGIDTGFSPVADALRAPDLSVGRITDAPGWVHGVPKLAVEYADTGQNEDDLTQKIADLLAAGTRLIWVVRLGGVRRVEVHEPGQPMRQVVSGDVLQAPGILAGPVPVDAFYDHDLAGEIDFRHVLRRVTGHDNLDAVRNEAKAKAVLTVLEARGLAVSEDVRRRILSCDDQPKLERWLRKAVTAMSADEAVAGGHLKPKPALPHHRRRSRFWAGWLPPGQLPR